MVEERKTPASMSHSPRKIKLDAITFKNNSNSQNTSTRNLKIGENSNLRN
jgi:hypothetical protein